MRAEPIVDRWDMVPRESHCKGSTACGRITLQPHQAPRIGIRIERPQILGALRRCRSAWIGMPYFSARRPSTPPFAVPSSLVMTMPVTPTICAKNLGLRVRVLPDRRVEHEEDRLRRGRVEFFNDANDLLQFGHQIGLVLQPPGRVDQQHIGAVAPCLFERDRRQVPRRRRPCGRAMTGNRARSPQT